ncbi:MAG: zeta toxin family protein [bacterium]|nr:zeta toxin family protein [bacterium]
MPERPTLHLIAGVNGAGKTSFYAYHLREITPGAEFVNADEIARDRWPGAEAEHNEEAARLAVERRAALMDQRLSFVTETVFSHASKLDLVREAQARGYRVLLYHVGLDNAELANARVATRVEDGGHDVPADRVAARFDRCQRLIPQAADLAETTYVFDNSGDGGRSTHRFVMRLRHGRIVRPPRERVPGWVREAYAASLAEWRDSP